MSQVWSLVSFLPSLSWRMLSKAKLPKSNVEPRLQLFQIFSVLKQRIWLEQTTFKSCCLQTTPSQLSVKLSIFKKQSLCSTNSSMRFDFPSASSVIFWYHFQQTSLVPIDCFLFQTSDGEKTMSMRVQRSQNRWSEKQPTRARAPTHFRTLS